MLRVIATLTTRYPPESFTAQLNITEIKGGALATYRIKERDADGKIERQIDLADYPRWSEPSSSLVARAMQAIWHDVPEDLEQVERIERVRVETWEIAEGQETLVFGWLLRKRGDSGLFEGWDNLSSFDARPVDLAPARSWHQLVVQGQMWFSFAQSTLPEWPTPVAVPILRSWQIDYIRVADVPWFARSAFLQYSGGFPALHIPNEEACVHAEIWAQFLSGI